MAKEMVPFLDGWIEQAVGEDIELTGLTANRGDEA